MSRQQRNTGGAPTPSAGTRMNEYFVPRDGIDREVISADICRYLGNDALVRPGHYENPQTGQTVQGYYITAYRNLTTAMIEDLKADSARWDSERRSQTSRNTAGGIHGSRDGPNYASGPSSNSPAVQYRYSETHQSRQHHGPTDNAPYQQDNYARDSSYDGPGPRYPGPQTPGYSGNPGPFPQQSQNFAPPSGGGNSNNNNNGPGFPGYQQPQQGSGQDHRFAAGGAPSGPMNPGFQSPKAPYISVGAHLNQRGGYPQQSDNYGGPRGGNPPAGSQSSMYPQSGQGQQGYPQPSQSPFHYQSQGPPPPGNPQQYSSMQPQDPFYGRASPAGQPQSGFAAQGQQQQQQYEETPPPRTSAAAASPQPPSSSNRRSDRESDRHPSDRHQRPPPRR